MFCLVLRLAMIAVFLTNVQYSLQKNRNPQGPDVNYFVAKGRDARWGEAFYQASLRMFLQDQVVCGGVLIEYHVVLTVAQCVYNKQ